VLSRFGKKKASARKAYHQYVQDGIEEGRRNDLVGGGLVRTLGGWSQVISLRKSKDKVLCDTRVLGQDKFVERIISEADKRIKGQLSINARKVNAEKRIHEICEKEGVFIEELKGGSRRSRLSEVRRQLAMELVTYYGLTLAETARQLGVSTSAISKIFTRKMKC
jgi:putative transposase